MAGPASSAAAARHHEDPRADDAPIPSDVSETGPSTRCNRCSPAISANNVSKSFRANKCFQLKARLPRKSFRNAATIHPQSPRCPEPYPSRPSEGRILSNRFSNPVHAAGTQARGDRRRGVTDPDALALISVVFARTLVAIQRFQQKLTRCPAQPVVTRRSAPFAAMVLPNQARPSASRSPALRSGRPVVIVARTGRPFRQSNRIRADPTSQDIRRTPMPRTDSSSELNRPSQPLTEALRDDRPPQVRVEVRRWRTAILVSGGKAPLVARLQQRRLECGASRRDDPSHSLHELFCTWVI